jgi:hypothetical protein
MKKFLATAILVAFAVTMIGCGGGGPKASFNDFAAAIKAKDAEKSWNLLSKGTQDSFNKMYDMIKGLAAMSPEGAKELEGVTDGKSFWKKAVTSADAAGADMTKEFENVTVTKEEVNGDKAILTVKSGDKEEKINMIKEGGAWKLDMSQEMGGVK